MNAEERVLEWLKARWHGTTLKIHAKTVSREIIPDGIGCQFNESIGRRNSQKNKNGIADEQSEYGKGKGQSPGKRRFPKG